MIHKRHVFMVIALVLCLLVISMKNLAVSAENVIQSGATLLEQNVDDDNSWGLSKIEEVLNIYGSTSAGNESTKSTVKLRYEEMGVYGVEYENIGISPYVKRRTIEKKTTGNQKYAGDAAKLSEE